MHLPTSLEVVDESLRRLSSDCLDLFYLHSPPASVIEQNDAFETVTRLRDAGKIRYLAFSIKPGESYPLDALEQVNLQAIQLPLSPGNSSDADVLLPWARANGTGTIVNMPFDKGTTLTPREGDWGLLADGSPRSLAQAAMRLALQNPNVTCAIPGTSNITHLEENVASAGWCRKVGGKLENWRKLLIVKHSERRCAAAERSLRHETSYGIDVAQSIFR